MHPLKQDFSIEFIEQDDISTLVRLLQLQNALLFMYFTEEGIAIFFNLSQS